MPEQTAKTEEGKEIEIAIFTLPPESYLDAYMAQKFFYVKLNGFSELYNAKTAEHAVPNMMLKDCWKVFAFWEKTYINGNYASDEKTYKDIIRARIKLANSLVIISKVYGFNLGQNTEKSVSEEQIANEVAKIYGVDPVVLRTSDISQEQQDIYDKEDPNFGAALRSYKIRIKEAKEGPNIDISVLDKAKKSQQWLGKNEAAIFWHGINELQLRLSSGGLAYGPSNGILFIESLDESFHELPGRIAGAVRWTARTVGGAAAEVITEAGRGFGGAMLSLFKSPAGLFGLAATIFGGVLFYRWKVQEQKLGFVRSPSAPLIKTSAQERIDDRKSRDKSMDDLDMVKASLRKTELDEKYSPSPLRSAKITPLKKETIDYLASLKKK